jgi:NADH-quinone oxidoreductase subunit I
MCEKNCPSGAIVKVEGEKKEGEKKKTATAYILDFTTCSQCGICVEVCPTDALAFSAEYNRAVYSREDCHFDLVKEYEKRKVH